MNLAALQQRDPYISDIVDTATQVALYSFNPKSNQWVSWKMINSGVLNDETYEQQQQKRLHSVSLMHAFKMVQLRSVNKSDLRWDTLSDVLLL